MSNSALAKYPVPKFEILRLRSLRNLKLLDSNPNPHLDELVRLAATVAETPMGALSLIDSDRQWFKSKIGLSIQETTRDIAFCAHTVMHPTAAFIIPDTTESDLFRDNPLVSGDPHIKMYAGFPINAPNHGLTIGSLCVLDQKAKRLSHYQIRVLQEIAVAIERTIEGIAITRTTG